MHILIVGNVLKDVYLNLDHRTEIFESDKNHTKWLNLGFNTSDHHYFRRISSFGGAAVTLEVLTKLGLRASINSSDFTFDDTGIQKSTPADAYRYILTTDDDVSYLTPTHFQHTTFIAPPTPPDYLYIDRSANLNHAEIVKLKSYLDANPSTRLILYLKNQPKNPLESLTKNAALILSEKPDMDGEVVYFSENAITYKKITEPINVGRIDTLTHLSAYSIAAATVLGSFLLDKTVEKSLRLARINVEHATLDSVLSLNELESIAKNTFADLELIAATLMAPKKGILAADESGGSIEKKFAQLNIPDTFENRHDYRNLFFTTPDINQYLSGVILFDETARDHMANGETIPDFLTTNRIIPGIKVDQGLEPAGDTHEFLTKGLDGLETRLREYYEMGLRFAKWRAAFFFPVSHDVLLENCRRLAAYAKKCQSAGLVPIVEPELVYDGNYSLSDSAFATTKILDTLVLELKNYKVNLKACLIKTNMVLAGKKWPEQSTPEEVGKATAEVLKAHIPTELAGIVFLSGGQTPEQATANLAAIIKNGPFPWPLTFSFARALQGPTLHAWHEGNEEKAKQAFIERLQENRKAIGG